MTPEFKTPRSPYEKVGGLVFLGRTIDKIRLKAAGQLRPDFFALMGDGYDARIMKHLDLEYPKFAEFVLTGATDEECWQYCVPIAGVWPCFVSFELKDKERVVAVAPWPADYGSNTQERCTM